MESWEISVSDLLTALHIHSSRLLKGLMSVGRKGLKKEVDMAIGTVIIPMGQARGLREIRRCQRDIHTGGQI